MTGGEKVRIGGKMGTEWNRSSNEKSGKRIGLPSQKVAL